jgi:hypothetical protein
MLERLIAYLYAFLGSVFPGYYYSGGTLLQIEADLHRGAGVE